jgi:folate-binding protein YgfZ
LRKSAAWLDLPGRGTIAVRGPDRTRLVHALTSNDIRGLEPGHGCYSFFLNEQGRVLANANVFCLENQILLDTEPETRATVLSHIEEFTIADDATTVDLSEGIATLSIEGPLAAEVLGSITAVLPATAHEIIEWPSGWVARVTTTGQPGFLMFVPVEERALLIGRLECAGAVQASAQDARTVRIENGMPRYGEEITSRFMALEVSQPHALSFHKGCYLGQEVVERVRSRNALSRVLMPVRFSPSSSADAGMKLFDGNQRAGEIMSAVQSPMDGRWVGIACIRADIARKGKVLSFDSGSVTI